MSEIFPASFSCSNNFTRLHNLLRSDGKYFVLEIRKAEINKNGDSSNLISVLSRVDLLPGAFTSKYISFARSYIKFLSDKLAQSALHFLMNIIFKRPPFNSNSLPLSRNVNKLLYKTTGIVLCINKILTLFQSESFNNLY